MSAERRSRWRIWGVLLTLLFLLGVAVMAALGWLLMAYPKQPGPGRGKLIELTLDPGADLRTVAAELSRQGALVEPHVFELYARVRGAQPRLRTGLVLVYDSMRPVELLQRVARGFGSAQLRVVIPEGFTRYDIAARLQRWGVCTRQALLAASEDPALLRELGIPGSSAEGYLYPDTYMLQDDMDPHAVVRRFVDNARKRLQPVLDAHGDDLARLKSELGFELQQVITLASIVEEEAQAASEQATIAGVFYNRLRDPTFMPKRLQADPTVLYGCLVSPSLPSCARPDPKTITRAMLIDGANAYNTYRHDGLPPGPIANPGTAAVAAVLSPQAHDFFYFVAAGGGRHHFSHSLQAHHAAVDASRPAQNPQPTAPSTGP